MENRADCLVIGSGVSGLFFALEIARIFPDKQIRILSKTKPGRSNTSLAQGGVAVVDEKRDSLQSHFQDTMRAGDFCSDPEVVRLVVKEGPEAIQALMESGVRFDYARMQELDWGKEGGHSAHRILHHKDMTGREIIRALIEKIKTIPNITLCPHHFVLDLLVEEGQCKGIKAWNLDSGEVYEQRVSLVFLATGGLGTVYGHTTNPRVATGDGIAMAQRVGAKIRDMEFIQFHPTALYEEGKESLFLVSEAVRGFGAYLRNAAGDRFMEKYDERLELAPRDIVARAIVGEMEKDGKEYVHMDLRHLDQDVLKLKFPTIYNYLRGQGFNPGKDLIPVVPAAHYLCGGIEVDHYGRTSIKNLYAGGECSRTGLHGANRLASNSLLEAVVYARRSVEKARELLNTSGLTDASYRKQEDREIQNKPQAEVLLKKLQKIMRGRAGVIRSTQGLNLALNQIEKIEEEISSMAPSHQNSVPFLELENMSILARGIVEQSLERPINKGGFFNRDFS